MAKIVLTEELIKKFAPRGNTEIIKALAADLPHAMLEYDINTKLRVAHFLAQAAHESDYFKTLQGYADGSAFEGRKDLGNVKPGDGKLFKERGIFQLAGRYNYTKFGKDLGVDLEGNPELAATPYWSTMIAAKYWEQRKINALADANDIEGVTKKINGGLNGLTSRKNLFAKVWAIIDQIVDPVEAPKPVEPPKVVEAPKPVTPAPVPPKATTTTPAPKTTVVTPTPPNKPKTIVAPAKKTVASVVKAAVKSVGKPAKGVIGVNVNLRAEGNTQAKILDVIKKGTVVEILQTSGSWTKVQLANKETGWIYKEYVHKK